MHVHPHVTRRSHARLAGVEPHADPDRAPGRPAMRREPLLRLGGRCHRVTSGREGDEEGVALSVGLMAIPLREDCSQEFALIGQDGSVVVAQLTEE
jgi:hypothetical protein